MLKQIATFRLLNKASRDQDGNGSEQVTAGKRLPPSMCELASEHGACLQDGIRLWRQPCETLLKQ